MTMNSTLAAFLRLLQFSENESNSTLDRLTTANAAAWLAHGNSYGVTAEATLLQEISDSTKHPVARAVTLTRSIVDTLILNRLPLSPPFQSVDALYGTITDDGVAAFVQRPVDPSQDEPQPRP